MGASAAGSESAHNFARTVRHCDRCDEILGELEKDARSYHYLGVDLHNAAEKPTCNGAPRMPDHISDAEEVNADLVNAYFWETNWRHNRWRRHEGDGGVESSMYQIKNACAEVLEVREYTAERVKTLRETHDVVTTTIKRVKEFEFDM